MGTVELGYEGAPDVLTPGTIGIVVLPAGGTTTEGTAGGALVEYTPVDLAGVEAGPPVTEGEATGALDAPYDGREVAGGA